MKCNLFFLLTAFCTMAFVGPSNFYEQSISTMDHKTVNFHRFEGKRVMVVVLPLGPDAGFSDQIAALAAIQGDSLVIIGVPGVETGYSDTLKERIKALYANEPDNFILAAGMNISKASGQHQSSFFQWLTDSKRNSFFDKDAVETEQKFFINKFGHLYAVFGSKIKLSDPIMKRVLSEHGH